MPHVLAQDLRNAVLQAAMTGKLTERRCGDSSVYNSLKLCNITFDEKKSEEIEPFSIPDTWLFVKIGDIADLLSGFAFKSSEYKTKGYYRLLRGINLSVGAVRWKDTVFVDEIPQKAEIYRLLKGDILLGLDRPWISEGIRVAIFDEESETYLVQRVLRIRESEAILKGYLLILLTSNLLNNAMGDKTTGISVPHISQSQVANTLIPLPPIEEQARIVARVDELMAKIDEYEKIEKELTELQKAFPGNMKDAILQAAMQGKLTEQLESDGDALTLWKKLEKEKHISNKVKDDIDGELPYDLPDNWATPKIGQIFDVIMGSSPKGEDISNDPSFGMEFHQGRIAFTNELIGNSGIYTSNLSKVSPENSVLLCVRAPIGTVNITDRKLAIGRGLCSITPVGNMSVRFALYLLRTLESTFVDKGTGSTFKAITADVVLNQRVPLPPIEEQQRIVDKLDQLLPLCEQLDKLTN